VPGISDALTPLVATSGIIANGYTVEEIRSNQNEFINAVISAGASINITLGANSGVYYDISQIVGEFSALITIPSVTYDKYSFENVPATIATPEVTNPTLEQMFTAVNGFGSPNTENTTTEKHIDNFYGFAIDLLLRTNASNSKLLLSEAAQRIYTDNTFEDTMGGGSTMTFSSIDTSFSSENMKNLMKAVTIVFMDDENNVIKYAGLDTDNAVLNGTELTADIKVYADNSKTAFVMDTVENGKNVNNDEIMEMPQNTVVNLTVLVYLDGDKVTNADVANGAQSMTGTMNLQFASDAVLEPMDYRELQENTVGNLEQPTITLGADNSNIMNVKGDGNSTSMSLYVNNNLYKKVALSETDSGLKSFKYSELVPQPATDGTHTYEVAFLTRGTGFKDSELSAVYEVTVVRSTDNNTETTTYTYSAAAKATQ